MCEFRHFHEIVSFKFQLHYVTALRRCWHSIVFENGPFFQRQTLTEWALEPTTRHDCWGSTAVSCAFICGPKVGFSGRKTPSLRETWKRPVAVWPVIQPHVHKVLRRNIMMCISWQILQINNTDLFISLTCANL